jgi:hypothetical protein
MAPNASKPAMMRTAVPNPAAAAPAALDPSAPRHQCGVKKFAGCSGSAVAGGWKGKRKGTRADPPAPVAAAFDAYMFAIVWLSGARDARVTLNATDNQTETK